MKKQQIVENLSRLGDFFDRAVKKEASGPLEERAIELISTVKQHNAWFTPEFVERSYKAWAEALKPQKIKQWISSYELDSEIKVKRVGVIMAGNIPMVGLHDALSVLISGHKLMAKLSSKDHQLMSLVLEVMGNIDANWKERITLAERLNEADLLIATGNDNSARYFEYYFRDLPKIIRKNRTSVAVLSHQVQDKQLEGLASDVFTYFGLGCRNVTKVYIPKDFELDRLFNAFYPYKEMINHNQYANNYDYNKAVYLMNKEELLENGFLLMKEDEGLHSPLGVLFYERYDDLEAVKMNLTERADSIQTVVSDLEAYPNLGGAQAPELWDYADNLDTISFLVKN